MNSQSWNVREAQESDVAGILQLIRELAIYENAGDEVSIDEETLLRDGFSEKKSYSALVAEANGEIIGMALYYPRYSTWKGKTLYLEDLVVAEAHRRMGVGKVLFLRLAQIAAEEEAARLEWQVLEWNEPAIAFYEQLDTAFDKEWVNCRLTGDQLKQYLQKK